MICLDLIHMYLAGSTSSCFASTVKPAFFHITAMMAIPPTWSTSSVIITVKIVFL